MADPYPGLAQNLLNVDSEGCPAPFIGESLHPYRGGFREGRNCAVNPLVTTPNASRCCIPCPVYDYTYRSDFRRLTDGAAWVHLVGFILCSFLLISHIVLPAKVTRRAYINMILLAGIMILELGFIIPLARQPPQCFDAVTPNGMQSNRTCAVSGGFAALGGMTLVSWVLVRALFMHLQICWNIVIDGTYYLAANIITWSTVIALTTAVLAHVGVSFRFGGYCHVNVGSFSTYWGWLLAFAGLSLLLQLMTFAYCVKVYLSAAVSGRQQLTSSSQDASSSLAGTTKSRNALIAARRLRSVLLLQWRSLLIVTIAIFTTAWISIIFVYFDDLLTQKAFAETDELIPWILCLIASQDAARCAHLAGAFVISEEIALATLYILALVGVEAFFLLFRREMMTAWVELVRKLFGKKDKRSSGEADVSGARTWGFKRESGGLQSKPNGVVGNEQSSRASDDGDQREKLGEKEAHVGVAM
ncbi:unnamed protein product [Zymoseptoria tritici ST99CH_1E4]|uniref:G-protein coupled receptors family 2 profile 2 domain-containing protein n=1 Tax=Zymoseptoria tritici ST99CH_1E4 TaxID=1276532 RepID=A0A2H1GHA2_ZYMTR|nr:unnamed protein product [Zymoseptoria tritici ST99CH_1E4]